MTNVIVRAAVVLLIFGAPFVSCGPEESGKTRQPTDISSTDEDQDMTGDSQSDAAPEGTRDGVDGVDGEPGETEQEPGESPAPDQKTPGDSEESPASSGRQTEGQQTSRASSLGNLVYKEGRVELFRQDKKFSGSSLGPGFEIIEYDLLQTGSNGAAQANIQTPGSASVEVKVGPDASFYFERAVLDDGDRTRFQMMSGTLSLAVDKLSGKSEVQLQTESAVLGVRGTRFEVTTGPDGSMLVTADEGQVICADPATGAGYFVQPGRVVYQVPGESLSRENVAVSQLDSYTDTWLSGRIEAFKQNAEPIIRSYAKRYDQQKSGFNAAYTSLMKYQHIWDKWERYVSRGEELSFINAGKDKKQVNEAVFDTRKSLVIFERLHYRLVELEPYHAKGIGAGSREGFDSSSFYSSFKASKSTMEKRMAKVRYIFYLYANINSDSPIGQLWSSTYTGGFSDDMTGSGANSGDDFFNDSEDFFDDDGDFFQ